MTDLEKALLEEARLEKERLEKERLKKQRDLTILEWCEKRRVSKPSFYKMARMGLAPETYELPGGLGQRISPSRPISAWEKRMLKLKKSKAGRQAATKRKKAAQNAANFSAQSPLHVSKKFFPQASTRTETSRGQAAIGAVVMSDADLSPEEFVAKAKALTGRECGDCTMCCKLLKIEEIQKPKNKWCVDCTPGKGCNIYATRPPVCRGFACQWLIDTSMGEEWKPSRSRMVISFDDRTPDQCLISVDPSAPGRWREEPYRSGIQRLVWRGLTAGEGPYSAYITYIDFDKQS